MGKVKSKDGTVIAYDKIGRGPVLILVGGAFSYRKFPGLMELAQLLSSDFTVINYDRRGRGDSGDTETYSVAREVDDLQAVIDETGGTAYVWGLSSGAALVLEAAVSGVVFEKIALYEPPYIVDEHETSAHATSAHAEHGKKLQDMIDAGHRDAAVKYFMKMLGVPGFIVSIMRLMPFWSRLRAVANTLPYDVAIMGDYRLPSEQIQSITTPTHVIAGGKSPAGKQETARAVARLLPNGTHQLLAGQNHNVSMKMLAPVLQAFYKR